MQDLKWDLFLETPPIALAYRQLQNMTSKAIRLHSRMLTPLVPHPYWYTTPIAHHVFIDEAADSVSYSLVHELCHALLQEENYQFLTGKFHNRVHPILSNEFQHPEIFRRMGEFGLDMIPHWSRWASLFRECFNGMLNEKGDRYVRYSQFLSVFTWFFFPQAAGACLNECRDFDPTMYQVAQAAFEAVQPIGFTTANRNVRSLEIFKTHWLRFCEEHLPKDILGNRIVDAVKNSRIQPIMVKTEDLYEHLQQYGPD